MYSYKWNRKTGGYTLVPQTGKFVAAEIRPVFAEELKLIGFDEHFDFDENEKRPICWAKQNAYLYRGEEIAKLEKTQYGRPLTPNYLVGKKALKPVDVESMLADSANVELMAALVADAQKRIKELYDQFVQSCNVAYIAFSGGKDSVLLLDLCHRTLPLSVPVVFSDTDMELPDTYKMWNAIQQRYPERTFLLAKAKVSALKNWKTFGPPSRTVRWCCSVHKSTPAILLLKELSGSDMVRAQAFIGVRNEESLSRSEYDDVAVGVKNASQVNAYPIISWGAHELWLYTLAENLLINDAYRKGLPRVGCVLCPEASEKYAWFVNAIYPKVIKPYNDIIIDSVDKDFKTREDRTEYLATAGWQARKSGETLKKQIIRAPEKVIGPHMNWLISAAYVDRIKSWLQTLGTVVENGEREATILYASGIGRKQHTIKIIYGEKDGEGVVSIDVEFECTAELRSFGKYVRQCINKAVACVGCRACEAECMSGALSFVNNVVSVNTTKCVHCLKCHSADYGCWRYQSMRTSEAAGGELSTINKYKNFGLRGEWINVYLMERENLSLTSSLGNKMIESGKAWMRQAFLMNDKNCEPKKLLLVAEKYGSDSRMLWDAMWIGLANRAAIVKWFVTATEVGRGYSADDLFALMGAGVKDTTKKGGISAFKDMLTKSPFGTGNYPVVQVAMKGKQVASMTRVAHAVEDLALLYGMFLIAAEAEQSSFSVSQLMNADFSAKYISPLVAFAMPVAEFKQQCQGLANRYGDFIHCNFTLGLDEIKVKRDDKTIEDVVELMLNA